MMKALILDTPGGVENLKLTELPTPIPKNDEVLVQVKAISINPVDVKTRAGKGIYGRIKEEHPLIIGWDIAGIVVETGKDVKTFANGDRVFGMINFPGHGKAYAEYAVAPASHLAKLPLQVGFKEGAAATLAALTAWQALTKHANLEKGQKILIHAASGGVGHFALQIAKHFGLYVIGTSSAKNRDLVLALGANEHIDYKQDRFEEKVTDADFVLDTVGGDNIERSVAALKRGGAVISILGNGTEVAAQKAKEQGVEIRSFLVHSSGEDMNNIAKLLETGAVKPYVENSFPFIKMGDAHLHVETNRTKGKVVVVL
jgi:NADPH:quinone reductase-like Zn-dependent oxidoreductase